MEKGKLYIISAPSGAGKTSLVKRLVKDVERLSVSVSHTTRSMRPGEIDGEDYYFVSMDDFQNEIKQDAFLEYAKVFDHFYGTALQTVDELLHQNIDVILEIDWQGAEQIRQKRSGVISIFILPPSIQILEQRLRNRGQDSESTIARRMDDAVTEISHYEEYDYLIVNDVFEESLQALKCIIFANRLGKERQMNKLTPLLSSLLGRPYHS
jgi:guanylate kinase